MQRFELKRHVSRRLALGKRLGPAPPGETIIVSVLLHPKDPRALSEAARAVSDPKSPGYAGYLTPDDLRKLVAPGFQDLDTVLSWLADAGLNVEETAGARMVVKARGTLEQVARAFDVPFGAYAFSREVVPAGRRCFACEHNPSIPAALAAIVRGVAGLNDLPAARRWPALMAPKRSRVPPRGPDDTRGPGGGFTPATIRKAYNVPDGGGRGERVGILEFGGGYSADDFDTFSTSYGLPGGGVREVSVSGAVNDYRGRTGGADVEVALDMDWVRASVPRAAIDLYWVPNRDTGWVDFLSVLLDATESDRPSVVSISWGMPEDGFSTSRRYDQTRQLFLACALLGITFVCAAGDAGAADEIPGSSTFDGQRHVDFPGVVPEVTAVGGTKLLPGARGFSERVWNDGLKGGATGGGFSHFVPLPGWQKAAVGKRTGVTGRGVPDVAAVASPDPGLSIFVRKRWSAAGGTSVAAPIWAGFLAQVNAARGAAGRPRLGAANAALYAAGTGRSPFRDVISGDNSYGGVAGFPAAKGWDPATGLGSADVAKLIGRLSAP
jgi:kumamolisin